MPSLGGGYRWCRGERSDTAGDGSGASLLGRGEVGDFLRTGRNAPPDPRCFPPEGRHREGLRRAALSAELQTCESTYGSRQ